MILRLFVILITTVSLIKPIIMRSIKKNFDGVNDVIVCTSCPVESISVPREVSVVEPLYIEKLDSGDNDNPLLYFGNDVSLLLNQKRLNSLGTDTVKAYLDSLQPRSSSLSELRSKLSDDDILKSIKSRHIQSVSELSAWIDYLNSSMEHIVSDAVAADQSKAAVDNTPPVDTSNVQTE